MDPLPRRSVVSSSSNPDQLSTATFEDPDDKSLTAPRSGSTDSAVKTAIDSDKPTSPQSPPLESRTSPPASPRSGPSAGLRGDSLPSHPSLYGSSPGRRALAGISAFNWQQRKRSIKFDADTASPKEGRLSSYSSLSMAESRSPPLSPPTDPRHSRLIRESEDFAESSADENTAIMNKHRQDYGATADDDTGNHVFNMPTGRLSKLGGGKLRNRAGRPPMQTGRQSEHFEDDEHDGWFRSLLDKYGSVELENKGSVARDHLALERTFLAWLRTSLSFASIGIAVTQLFRLNTSLQSSQPGSSGEADSLAQTAKLRQVGKPLGATFLGISILVLVLGFHRFFESQHYVIRGKFPASRVTIILVSFVALALIVASLVVIVAVAPSAFEKR